MDTLKAIQFFLDKMFTEVAGMKVLLLDPHTVSFAPPLGVLDQLVRLVSGDADELSSPLVGSVSSAVQTPIVSLATTQSSLLTHEVYLTDRIEK
jgi:hypothetical protein